MPPIVRRRTLLGVLLSGVLVGAVTAMSADTATLAVGLGVVLVLGLTGARAVACAAVPTMGAWPLAASRLRRQWGRTPIPLLEPDLAGKPQPRAPGHRAPEAPVPAAA